MADLRRQARQSKYDWRAHLTPDERRELDELDEALLRLKRRSACLSKRRYLIQQRGINRAKYRERRS